MDVDITKNTGDLECIRCGECITACPTQAISTYLALKKKSEAKTSTGHLLQVNWASFRSQKSMS